MAARHQYNKHSGSRQMVANHLDANHKVVDSNLIGSILAYCITPRKHKWLQCEGKSEKISKTFKDNYYLTGMFRFYKTS